MALANKTQAEVRGDTPTDSGQEMDTQGQIEQKRKTTEARGGPMSMRKE